MLLVLLLVSIFALALTFVLNGTENLARAEDTSSVIYLVPDDLSQVADIVKPERLIAEQIVPLRATTQWSDVRQAASQGKLKVLVIHYKAIDKAEPDELKVLFKEKDVTVAGIGIPGLDLAELVGVPTLFTATWPQDVGREAYTTPHYFYIYSYSVKGDGSDIEKLEAEGWRPGQSPPDNIPQPLSVSGGASTDSLLTADGVPTLLHLIKVHVGES